MIRGLVPKERLLEWYVEDGWEPLCEFLGKPVPDMKFPRANAATGGWKSREVQCNEKWIQGVFRKLSLAFLVLLCASVLLLRRYL